MKQTKRDNRQRTSIGIGEALQWGAAAFLVIGVPLLLVRLAVWQEPGSWDWGDWVSQLTQILTGVVFFALAWFISRRSNRRAEAVANAELITSMGALSTSSARSYAGNDAQALRIGADARAALQHYLLAGQTERVRLTETVTDAYSDLIFGTFSRANGLPRSTLRSLCDSANDVVRDAETLAASRDVQADDLRSMADHIRFAVRLGKQVRSSGAPHDQPLAKGKPRALTMWPPDTGGSSVPRANTRDQQIRERVDLLELLYRRELTVVRDWDVLRTASASIQCSVVLHDVADGDPWLSPWYVTRPNPGGKLKPVNVNGDKLGDENARFDDIDDDPGLPTHPFPLSHAEVPPGMRVPAINSQIALLSANAAITVCVLTYEIVCNDGAKRKIVLDGNHRLAAARRVRNASDVRILEFSIVELERVEISTSLVVNNERWTWKGFTPDIEKVRAAW